MVKQEVGNCASGVQRNVRQGELTAETEYDDVRLPAVVTLSGARAARYKRNGASGKE